jgi:hypothetical protein
VVCVCVLAALLLTVSALCASVARADTFASTSSRMSEARRIQLHAGQIRSKLRSHSESATALYLLFKLHGKSGPLALAPLRAGLERCECSCLVHPCVPSSHRRAAM